METLMKKDIEQIYEDILKSFNYIIPVSAKSRSGAEISDYLEDAFVDYIKKNKHQRIYNAEGSPKGATKNPYDFCFNYRCTEFNNFDDLIWADIKATKFSYEDSNPDLGTPEKIIKFILDGHFYLLFVFFEYDEQNNNSTKFLQFPDKKFVHCQFLKDINHTVRINPKPQFQVNIHEPEEYRTIDSFIELFYKKYDESIDRILEKQKNKKEKLSERFNKVKQAIQDYCNQFNK